jgi:peptidyl-prolyl cis-trans isomerase SurA
LAAQQLPCVTPNLKDKALLDFPGKAQVMRSEFEYVYAKNNGGCDSARAHSIAKYEEYLKLYVNFKRKVLEARELGLDKTPSFQSEFAGYQKQLAQPYLIERDFQEKLIQEAYERSKTMISASHILVNCGPDATPADTLRAYNKALMLRDSVVSGKTTFAKCAFNNSSDPSAKKNNGDLGYFSAFDMVYPFETGAYNTQVGQVSMPVRSGFGYHLIKVNDRVTSPGKQKASHIMIRIGPQYSAKDTVQAIAKINEIYKRLQEGADWDEMVQNFSDDGSTKSNKGDLGNGRLIPEMENMKRQMKQGEYSKPFNTAYGWHILKVTSVEPIKTFEESKAEIKSRINRDARSYLSRERLVNRVKQEGKLEIFQANLDEFAKSIPVERESEYARGFWKPDDTASAIYQKPLYAIGNGASRKTGTVMDYIRWYMKARKGYEGATIAQATAKNLEIFTEEVCLSYEETQLPAKYPEYAELLKEYSDGILLFTLTEEKVWRKAVEDTTGLRNYFNSNPDKFRADERIVCIEYVSEVKANIENVQRLLQKGNDRNAVDSIINKDNPLNVRIRTQKFEKGKSPEEATLFAKQPGYTTDIMKYGNAWRILVVQEKLPAGPKTFEDSKSECITQYQNHLEAEWLKSLEQKYPVKVKKGVLKKLYK